MERETIEERLSENNVLNEISLLNQYLQRKGNGSAIHKIGNIREAVLGKKRLMEREKYRSDITFRELKNLNPRIYDSLIKRIGESILLYDYKI